MKNIILVLLMGLMTSSPVIAVTAIYSSTKPFEKIEFSSMEKQQHLMDVEQIVVEASRCMNESLEYHDSFYRQYGISPFFGDQSYYGKLSWSDRKDYLKNLSNKLGKNYPKNMVENIKPFSCVGLAIKCLGRGFKNLGANSTWNKIAKYTKDYGQTGLAMQHALQQLGWTSVYWNADTSRNKEWDALDKQKFPSNQKNYWGQHTYTYEVNVLRKRRYYFNQVDNFTFLTDFYETPPARLREIPFFLAVANLGYHVFLGNYGTVIEAHSTRRLTDYQTVETSPFNPLARGGGPRGTYFSGLMVVPPYYIAKDSEETRLAKQEEVKVRKQEASLGTVERNQRTNSNESREGSRQSQRRGLLDFLWFN